MDADQKLTELKKAFAEVILNTSKEAAARIIVSERKVARLETELKQAKENAIQMLMRLKKMMDAKNREAEMASQAQNMRIEELEAQLHEAEDIVTDLREELSAAHGKKASPPQKGSNIFGNSVNEKSNRGRKPYNFIFPTLKSCINEKDLPAIILRGKGTKRDRSHECERTVVDTEVPSLIKRASPNKKMRASGPEQPLDYADSGSLVKHSIPKKHTEEGINTVAGLVNVRDCFSRLRVELKRPPTPIREELLPVGCENREMPLTSEVHVDRSMDLVSGVSTHLSSRVIKYTFHRKRKQGTNGCDLRNKLKMNEENKDVALEPETVISLENSTQEETEKVISIEKSTQETEKVIPTEDSTQETAKVIQTEESIQEETEQVNDTEESTQETGKVIPIEESTQEETEKVVETEESTQETEKVIPTEESTQEETEKVVETEASTQETEKVIPTEKSTQEETEKVVETDESTQEMEKVIPTEESTQEETEKIVDTEGSTQVTKEFIATEESTQDENLELVAPQLACLSGLK